MWWSVVGFGVMGCKFKSPSAFFSLSWGASWALVASVWGWGWGHKLWRIADQAEFLEELPLVPGSGLVWAGEIVKLKDSWPLNCGPRVSTNTSWETNVRGDSREVPRWGMLWALQEMHSWQVFEVLGSYSGCKGAGNPPPRIATGRGLTWTLSPHFTEQPPSLLTSTFPAQLP